MIMCRRRLFLFIVLLVIIISGCGSSGYKKQLPDCKIDVSEFESKLIKMDDDFNESFTRLTNLSSEIYNNPSRILELKALLEECKDKAHSSMVAINYTKISPELPEDLVKVLNITKERIRTYYFARMKFAENILNSMNNKNERYSTNEKLLQEAEAFRIQGGLALAQAKTLVGLN